MLDMLYMEKACVSGPTCVFRFAVELCIQHTGAYVPLFKKVFCFFFFASLRCICDFHIRS
jgi:hypothetical protein